MLLGIPTVLWKKKKEKKEARTPKRYLNAFLTRRRFTNVLNNIILYFIFEANNITKIDRFWKIEAFSRGNKITAIQCRWTHLNALVKFVVGVHVQSGKIPDDVELESHLYRRPVTHRVVFPSDPFAVFCKNIIFFNFFLVGKSLNVPSVPSVS